MDLITLSLAKGYANKVAAGFKRVEVQGSNLVFTLNDDSKATVAIPTPADGKDGVSVIDLSIDNDGSLLCHMSDGTTIDAGYVPTVDPDLTNYYTKEEIDEGFSGIRKLKFEEPNNMSNYYNYWLYSGECGDFSPIFSNNEPLEVIWDGVSYTLQYNGDMTWGYLDIGPCYISLNNERINTTDTSEYHSVIIKDIRGNIILGDLISSEFIDLNNYATKEYVNGKFPVSWNDVLDRPGMYDEEETITLLENAEITVTTIDNGRGYVREESNIKNVFANTTMKYNVNYIVVFDGVTYYKPTYFNTPMPAYHSALGNEYLYTNSSYSDNTGEPFAFDEYGTFYCVADQPGTHTLSIYELTGNIITVKIPEKYLPETAFTSEQDVYILTPIEYDAISFFRSNTSASNNLYFQVGTNKSDLESQIKTVLQKAYDKGNDNYGIVLNINSTNVLFGTNYMITTKPTSLTLDSNIIQQQGVDFKNTWFRKIRIVLTLTWDGDIITSVRATLNAIDSLVLTSTNETAFTPTLNYHPATKKYVDDAIGDISTILSTLTTVSEVSE